jgi:hypothetical protein
MAGIAALAGGGRDGAAAEGDGESLSALAGRLKELVSRFRVDAA